MIEIEYDVREPYFLSNDKKFYFYFFKAGTNPLEFIPGKIKMPIKAINIMKSLF